MFKILTKKETNFLIELAVILKRYDVMIAAKDKTVEISIFDGDDVENGEVKNPIKFYSEFDESDIYELMVDTKEIIDNVSEIKELINNISGIKGYFKIKRSLEEEE
ncbi:hypothetical protein H8744_03805 [Oscillospiraceae bacterium N12]|jgi:hypothetical protein|uniref:Uncharacterized protein n=1 Tax=Jilunia laotingensis TaxID=2763675 RepID=A0A926IPC5_9BACT|nr:hypothetical protein [Jilunia laotingensis]MBC8592380.1 hypothetical protein [Jilunia laotingensis]